MEDMSIVFFYADRKQSGRKRLEKKRFGRWKWSLEYQYNVYLEKWEMGAGSLSVWCVGLPCLETDKGWTGSEWKKYVKGLPIPPESRFVYYVPDKNAGRMLGREREPIGLEWILTLIECYSVEFDGLVLIQDRELEAEDLIRYFAATVPYLGVVKDFSADWDEIEESLSMEYGLTIDIKDDFNELHIKGDKTLVIIGGERVLPQDALIKDGSVLLFTKGRTGEDRKGLKGKNVFVVDIDRFLKDTVLDTVRKIKYNSTR